MKKDIKRIAIVRLSALGDIVNTAVVLQFIKSEFPHAKIEWITEEVFAPLLMNHPLISAVHTLNLKQLKKEKSISNLFKTISYLKNLGEFDIIIDIQGLLKSAVVAWLIGKNRHGFDKNSSRESISSLFYKTTSTISYGENVVKRNCFVVGDGLGFEISDKMILDKEPIFAHLKERYLFEPKQNGKKNIAIVIGASWESKKYPKESVAQLCNKLQQNCIILWGNEIEKEYGMWICENSDCATLAPKLSLTELISLISNVDLLIGNDTGPTHMAWAQNIPSITLFGPTTTRMIYETPLNIGIKSPSKVDINKIDKNDFSIEEIKVNDILQNAKRLLK
ncbi:MAG: lipopolysaccharide heptosyltransferase I [Campylobacterota bacterium]|nr:lipopolysaccharide heptosyltransferase I [Campylobacterota bacterium]